MLSMLKTNLTSATKLIQQQQLQLPLKMMVNYFHCVTAPQPPLKDTLLNGLLPSRLSEFLRPQNHSLLPSCGFKVMGKVRRRCKDCYMVRRQERLYNLCKTHRRHKQMSMVKDFRNTLILSHATQSKVRPW